MATHYCSVYTPKRLGVVRLMVNLEMTKIWLKYVAQACLLKQRKINQ